MSKRQIVTANFLRGLQDTAQEDGLPYPGWSKFFDLRVSEGGARRRLGLARVARATTDNKSLDFVAATSHYVDIPMDTRVWALGPQFTIEGLVKLDAVSGTLTYLYAGVTTLSVVIDTASSKLRLRVWDSAASTTTLASTDDLTTSATPFQIVRDGASLTMRLNNSATAGGTATMSATLSLRTPSGAVRLCRDTSTNYLDGQYDYLRVLKVVRANHRDAWLRFPDPRAPYVLADYDFNQTAVGHIVDRSAFGNTGRVFNAPSVATALCAQTDPVSLIHSYRTRSGERRVLVVAGNNLYNGVV